MKKLYLLFFVFIFSEASSQHIGIGLGPSLMNQRINQTSKRQYGLMYNLAFFYENQISNNSFWGVETGLHQKGSAVRLYNFPIDKNRNGVFENDEYGNTFNQKLVFNNALFNIFFKQKFLDEAEALRPYLLASIYATYTFNTQLEGFEYQYKYNNGNVKYNFIKPFNYGALFGAGISYELSKFGLFFETKYAQDLSNQIFRQPYLLYDLNSNAISLPQEEVRNNGILFTMGIYIKLQPSDEIMQEEKIEE